MTLPMLDNANARRLFLHRHALIEPPSGPAKGAELLSLIHRLGFVQVDSINTVERAHHMILWSRRQSYRPRNLATLLEKDRALFEHWTHDASVIPAEFFPYWNLRFKRDAARIRARWADWHGSEFHAKIEDVRTHVRENGRCGSGDVGEDEKRGKGGWWEWQPVENRAGISLALGGTVDLPPPELRQDLRPDRTRPARPPRPARSGRGRDGGLGLQRRTRPAGVRHIGRDRGLLGPDHAGRGEGLVRGGAGAGRDRGGADRRRRWRASPKLRPPRSH